MGGGGGGSTKTPFIQPAGGARPLGTYPQYNPMPVGLQPGQATQAPGAMQSIPSYMPSVAGQGFQPGMTQSNPLAILAALQQGLPGMPSQGWGTPMPQMGAIPISGMNTPVAAQPDPNAKIKKGAPNQGMTNGPTQF